MGLVQSIQSYPYLKPPNFVSLGSGSDCHTRQHNTTQHTLNALDFYLSSLRCIFISWLILFDGLSLAVAFISNPGILKAVFPGAEVKRKGRKSLSIPADFLARVCCVVVLCGSHCLIQVIQNLAVLGWGKIVYSGPGPSARWNWAKQPLRKTPMTLDVR